MSKKFSISRKLVFFVVIVSITAIAVTTIISFTSAERIIINNTQDLLVGEASIRGDTINVLLEKRIKDVQILTKNKEIQAAIVLSNNNKQDMTDHNEEFLKIISEYQRNIGHSIGLEDVQIINNQGNVIFSLIETNRQAIKDYFLQDKIGEKTSPTIEFISINDNARKIMISYPVVSSGSQNMEGTVIAILRTNEVDSILLNRSGLGETGEVYLVNDKKVLVSESRFKENAVFDQGVDTPPVIKCFEDKINVEGETYVDYRQVPIFGASYCLPDIGLVLIAEIDESETFQPINTLQKEILVVGIIMTAIIGTIAFTLSNLISRPLVKLTSAVNEIAEGNFDVRTNIRTKDEIGHLSLAFDSMAKKMQDALISIKQRDDIIKQQEEDLLKFSDSGYRYCVGFVDIVNSTKITSLLSDADTDKFYSIFLNSVASIITKFDGLVVKNIGDALLFYFPQTNSTKDIQVFKKVLDCSIAIKNSHEEINKKMSNSNLPKTDYRTSIAYGSVRIAKVMTSSIDDIFGSTVNKCSKINRMAKPNGIVIGSNLYEIVKSFSGQYNFEKISSNEMMSELGYDTVYAVSEIQK